MNQFKQFRILGPFLCLPALLFAGGCGDDTGGTVVIPCPELDASNCPADGETGGDDGSDPVDESDESGDMDANFEPCVLRDDGHDRTVHQCDGSLGASIHFKTLLGNCGQTLGDPDWCEEFHEFGVDFDDYATPSVMACCDPETATPEQVFDNCASDVLEQVCRSIPARLEKLLEAKVIKVKRDQARALTRWLNAHQQDCFDALRPDVYDEPGVLEPRTWKVNGGDNKDWPALDDFTIRFEGASITDASVPADASEHLACQGIDFNNDQVFESEVVVSPGVNQVRALSEAAGDARVASRVGEREVTGAATLATRSSCTAPRCSSLSVTTGPNGALTLEELEIYGAGPAAVTDGEIRVAVERPALRLYGVSHGTQVEVGLAGEYTIPAGDALFVISGDSGFAVDIRLGRNATPLQVHKVGGGWVLDSFVVEHVRESGELLGDRRGPDEIWRLSLPTTTWD